MWDFLGKVAIVVSIGTTVFGLIHWQSSHPSRAEALAWNAVMVTNSCDAYREFISNNPSSPFAEEAQAFVAASRTTSRTVYKPFTQSISTEGSSSEQARDSRSDACEEAMASAIENAAQLCDLHAGENSVNATYSAEVEECSCTDYARVAEGLGVRNVWGCSANAIVVCKGERAYEESVESCGPI